MTWHYLSGNLITETVFSARAYAGCYQQSEPDIYYLPYGLI